MNIVMLDFTMSLICGGQDGWAAATGAQLNHLQSLVASDVLAGGGGGY